MVKQYQNPLLFYSHTYSEALLETLFSYSHIYGEAVLENFVLLFTHLC